MNVLRVTPHYFPFVTGPANQARAIATLLAAQGHRETLVTTNHGCPPDTPAESDEQAVTVHRLRQGPGFMAYRAVRDLHSLTAAAHDADLIHAHLYRNRLTTHAATLARRLRKPYVLQPHGTLRMYREILVGPAGKLGQLPYRAFDTLRAAREVFAADAVVLATTQERDEAIAFGVDPERAHVIPVGVKPEIATAIDQHTPRPAADAVRFLMVGNLNRDRNPELAIQAAARAARETSADFTLDIVGPAVRRSLWQRGGDYLAHLRQRASQLGIADRVRIVGPLTGDDLLNAYLNADVFINPTRYENFGQATLEAAACGLALLCTPTGVARDFVAPGRTGFFINPTEPGALADRIAWCTQHPNRVTQLKHAARMAVQSRYHWPTIVEQYRELYRSLGVA
ncbi:MAG: glycosyltransferase family 4 protein [Planctomycetota bacterium]